MKVGPEGSQQEITVEISNPPKASVNKGLARLGTGAHPGRGDANLGAAGGRKGRGGRPLALGMMPRSVGKAAVDKKSDKSTHPPPYQSPADPGAKSNADFRALFLNQ
jgi:hypothetical protein